jgi:hypothetical protein
MTTGRESSVADVPDTAQARKPATAMRRIAQRLKPRSPSAGQPTYAYLWSDGASRAPILHTFRGISQGNARRKQPRARPDYQS